MGDMSLPAVWCAKTKVLVKSNEVKLVYSRMESLKDFSTVSISGKRLISYCEVKLLNRMRLFLILEGKFCKRFCKSPINDGRRLNKR